MTAIAYAENTLPSSRAADASMQLGGGTGLYTTGLIRTGRDPHCGHGTGLFTTGLQSWRPGGLAVCLPLADNPVSPCARNGAGVTNEKGVLCLTL